MSKKLITLLVLGLLILGVAQLGYATETEDCPLNTLTEADKAKADEIIESFRVQMAELREKMAQVRGTGDREARDEIHSARKELQAEKRTAIADLLPEGVKEQYMERAFQRGQGKREHAPAESQVRAGGNGNGKQMRSASDNI